MAQEKIRARNTAQSDQTLKKYVNVSWRKFKNTRAEKQKHGMENKRQIKTKTETYSLIRQGARTQVKKNRRMLTTQGIEFIAYVGATGVKGQEFLNE